MIQSADSLSRLTWQSAVTLMAREVGESFKLIRPLPYFRRKYSIFLTPSSRTSWACLCWARHPSVQHWRWTRLRHEVSSLRLVKCINQQLHPRDTLPLSPSPPHLVLLPHLLLPRNNDLSSYHARRLRARSALPEPLGTKMLRIGHRFKVAFSRGNSVNK